MARKMQFYTHTDIKVIEAMPYAEAMDTAHALIEHATKHEKYPLSPLKAAALHTNVSQAVDVAHIAWVFYNMLLAGEGLGCIHSKYQKQFA